MNFKISILKFLILIFVFLSTIFCITLTNQYRMVIFCIGFIGFVLSFLSYSKSLIMNKAEDKLILLNSYFDDTITEQIKNISLKEYKSCTISQRNISRNKEANFTNEPTQYDNEFYLKIFADKEIIEPFSGNSSKEKIEIFEDKIARFFKSQEGSLMLKEDYQNVLRYMGYVLILLANFIGYTLIIF